MKDLPACVVEVIGNLPDDLNETWAYFGFEPSGRLHRGILNPVAALTALAERGAYPSVLVADRHAALNGKACADWSALKRHLPPDTEILLQSEDVSLQRTWSDLSDLAQVVGVRRAVRAIDCAGREANETMEGVKMAAPIYALLQAVDMHILDVDIAIGGTDQRKVHMLARDAFPKLGWKVPTMVHTAILLDREGRKMSKSNPATCEWL